MDSKQQTVSVLVVEDGGVGKSWLIKRLVRYLNYDIIEELDESIQTFVEHPPPGQPTITLEQTQIPYTYEVVADGITITLKEAYGFHSIIDQPLQEHIKTIARDSQKMNLCVYVVRFDHQLAGEGLTQLQELSAQIGSKKLIIFLSRKYILMKDKQIEEIKQYNKQKGLFRKLVDDNIQHLVQLIIGSSTSFNSQSSMIQEPPSQKQRMDSSYKNIIVLGLTGAGKSFVLNLLLGAYCGDDDDGIFEIAESEDTCTQVCQAAKGTLWGEKSGIPIHVIDMPGLFDTRDDRNKQYKDKVIPPSIKHLIGLQEHIQREFQNKVNRVILCIDGTSKNDNRAKLMVTISDILMPAKQKVCVFITKCNYLPRGEKDSIKDSWVQVLNQQGVEEVFFFEDSLDKVDKRFEQRLTMSIQDQMRNWDDLSLAEKNTIGKAFNYSVSLQACQLF